MPYVACPEYIRKKSGHQYTPDFSRFPTDNLQFRGTIKLRHISIHIIIKLAHSHIISKSSHYSFPLYGKSTFSRRFAALF